MAALLARVRRTIDERRLVRRGEVVLCGVSGGPDSIAMLDVLHRLSGELGIELAVATVDHGLRPEAAAEAELVRAAAKERTLPFVVLRVDVGSGASIQGRARTARYAALRDHARAIGARRVAVGHVLDDQAETVLARLLRGAGVRGLAGIAPRRADGVIRPLIDARRTDVAAWNVRHALTTVLDPSNLDSRYQRVRLRHELLPALATESEHVAEHLARLADDARAHRALTTRAARRLLHACRLDARTLDAVPLLAAPGAVRTEALRRFLEEITGAGARRAHLDATELALQGRGVVRLPGDWCVTLVQGSLRASRSESDRAHAVKKHETRGLGEVE